MADTVKDISDLVPEIQRGSRDAGHVWTEVGIIVGASCLIVLGFVVWARFFRNRQRHRRSNSIMGQLTPESGDGEPRRGRRRNRPQSQRYSRRNPTLAETGGLPPLRAETADGPDGRDSGGPGHLPS